MKDKKLTSMVEFVKLKGKKGVQSGRLYNNKQVDILFEIYAYQRFLSQTSTLGDFVPCVDGVPIDEPKEYKDWLINSAFDFDVEVVLKCAKFQQAQSRVLFEGFEMTVNVHGVWYVEGYGGCICSDSNSTIEDIVKLKPTLTETALKQLR